MLVVWHDLELNCVRSAGMRHRQQLARKERMEFMSLSYTKGTWIIIFGVLCIFLNLLILFKMIL